AIVALTCLAWGQTLEQAKRAFDAGNYAEAARLFEKSHQASPRCDTLFFLGMARYRLKQVDNSLIAFQSAVHCDPKLVLAHLALAEAYTERGNQAEALAAFTKVLALEPRNGSALRGAASIYLELQLNEKAVPLLETLVQVDGKNPQAHAELGAAYFAVGNLDGARVEFKEALRLKPDHASALLGAGNVYLKAAEEEQAIPLLQRAAKIIPQAYQPRFLLGSAYNRLGRYQEAAAELERAVRLGANDPEVFYHLARAYGGLDRQEDRRKALAQFALETRKSKESIEATRRALRLMDQARALVDSGDLEAAAARVDEARELRPSDDLILFRLAGLHYDLGR
ncbi:MAG: tetratricopeptide repeat protein, partial [Candidatus Solibacter sp.]|nr:tetratricopeptide repeat protein [Candidatus Solibacter sp.]